MTSLATERKESTTLLLKMFSVVIALKRSALSRSSSEKTIGNRILIKFSMEINLEGNYGKIV